MKHTMIAFAAAGLWACATTGTAPDQAAAAPGVPGTMTCSAQAAQVHLGQTASQSTGSAILAASGARTLRWGPPGGAWTMDYRLDRVNVRYDDTMKITDITCG